MKEHLPWIIPAVIAVFGALWIVERSVIPEGPVRMAVLEHRVDRLEKLHEGRNNETGEPIYFDDRIFDPDKLRAATETELLRERYED